MCISVMDDTFLGLPLGASLKGMAGIDDDIDLNKYDFNGDIEAQIGDDPVGNTKLRLFMKRADQLMERLQNLYTQYFVGIEKFAPREQRAALDQLMTQLYYLPKTTPALRFRHGTLQGKYASAKERWDKKCRDIDAGLVRRPAGPKNRAA
jgi:hypothetical protein